MPYTPPALPPGPENQKNLSQLKDMGVTLETLNNAVTSLIAGTSVLDVCQEYGLDHNTLTAAIKTALRQRTLEFENQAEVFQSLVVARLQEHWAKADALAWGDEEKKSGADVRWAAEARMALTTLHKIISPYLKKTEDLLEKGATKVINPTIFKGTDLFILAGKNIGGSLADYADMTAQDLIRDDVENLPEYAGVQVNHGRHKPVTIPAVAGTDGDDEEELAPFDSDE